MAAFLVAVLTLVLLWSLPRGRERSRHLACRRNLMQIGAGLALYSGATGFYPAVILGEPSPIASLLGWLGQPDFGGLDATGNRPSPSPGFRVVEKRVRGLTCPSDTAHLPPSFPAPIHYRANLGSTIEGKDGPFGFGRPHSPALLDADKGLANLAVFSERVLGPGLDVRAGIGTYRSVPGRVSPSGCPANDQGAWMGDGGRSWMLADWTSTLYSHAPRPNAAESCQAADGQTAWIGASSRHAEGVNVLLGDGSLRTIRPGVDPTIWTKLGQAERISP